MGQPERGTAPDYRWPTFPDDPDDLWPDRTAATDQAGWQQTLAAFLADRQALVELINDPAVDLFAPLLGSGEHRHILLREINIIAAHNAYHTGELGILANFDGNGGGLLRRHRLISTGRPRKRP